MNRPAASHRPHTNSVETSLESADGGWHCSHLYYSWDRAALALLSAEQRSAGREALMAALDPEGEQAPTRLQTLLVSGHKADLGLMMLDPNPLKIDLVHQRLMAGPLGSALKPTYSFVSLTEISEYVPSIEQYGQRIVAEGEEEGSAAYQTKVKAYENRLETMNRQRLTPEFPPYPNMCFYPMNKKRKVGENWFMLSKADRNTLMSEHARSGMAFAGKVSQLITVGLGFDDWEWGVTLWAARPEYLKEIVYKMRFDEASARYAEFGPFLAGSVCSAEAMLDHCLIGP